MAYWVIGYVLWALIYAVALSFVVLVLLVWLGRSQPWRHQPVMISVLFFIFLTQHPFPDVRTLVCPVTSAVPQLQPFNFLNHFRELAVTGAGLGEFMTNRTVAATVMNFVVCAIIGALLRPYMRRIWLVGLVGFLLSFGLEAAQLTGLFGFYPCAYRQFNVDDLLMNTLGVLVGHSVARFVTDGHFGRSGC